MHVNVVDKMADFQERKLTFVTICKSDYTKSSYMVRLDLESTTGIMLTSDGCLWHVGGQLDDIYEKADHHDDDLYEYTGPQCHSRRGAFRYHLHTGISTCINLTRDDAVVDPCAVEFRRFTSSNLSASSNFVSAAAVFFSVSDELFLFLGKGCFIKILCHFRHLYKRVTLRYCILTVFNLSLFIAQCLVLVQQSTCINRNDVIYRF